MQMLLLENKNLSPRIRRDYNEKVWKTFLQKWTMFKYSTEMSEWEKLRQLYQCCNEDLGDAILKGHVDIVKFSEQELLCMIKQLAVIPVSVVVGHYNFLSSRQDLFKNTRSFADRSKGKGTTYLYSCTWLKDGCNQVVDFLDFIVKNVLVTGITGNDLCRKVLGRKWNSWLYWGKRDDTWCRDAACYWCLDFPIQIFE